jgi:hypothetical protein
MSRPINAVSVAQVFLTLACAAALAACGSGSKAPRGDANADTPAAAETPVAEEGAATEEAAAAEAPAATEPVAEETMQISAGVAKAGTAADPAAGDVIPYAQLEQHVGHRAELTTTMGSVRRGVILSSNAFQTEVQLDAADRGFKVIVVADQVAQVRLLPDEATAPAAAN